MPFNELSLSLDKFKALISLENENEDSSIDNFKSNFKLANEDILNNFKDLNKEISKFIKSKSLLFKNLFTGYSLSSLLLYS